MRNSKEIRETSDAARVVWMAKCEREAQEWLDTEVSKAVEKAAAGGQTTARVRFKSIAKDTVEILADKLRGQGYIASVNWDPGSFTFGDSMVGAGVTVEVRW